MEELVDLIATDASASDVSDKIKDALMAKASARIDALRPIPSNTTQEGEVLGDQPVDEDEDEAADPIVDAQYQKDTKIAEI